MAIINIESTKQYNEEIKSGTVLVDFMADWCGPCKMMAPLVEQLSEENPDIKVLEVNVDQQQELATEFKVMSIPTLIVYKDGKIDKKVIGLQPKQKLEALVK